MIEAGILDGDTAIIKRTDVADNGEIVVALVDNSEVTLKRLRRRGASVALEPANRAYETRIFGRTGCASRVASSASFVATDRCRPTGRPDPAALARAPRTLSTDTPPPGSSVTACAPSRSRASRSITQNGPRQGRQISCDVTSSVALGAGLRQLSGRQHDRHAMSGAIDPAQSARTGEIAG